MLSKDDILWLLQAKVPNALRLAEIVCVLYHRPCLGRLRILCWPITSKHLPRLERSIGKSSSMYYCFAPPISRNPAMTLRKSKSSRHQSAIALSVNLRSFTFYSVKVSQNKMCTITVFSLQKVKYAMKLSCRCKGCKLTMVIPCLETQRKDSIFTKYNVLM